MSLDVAPTTIEHRSPPRTMVGDNPLTAHGADRRLTVHTVAPLNAETPIELLSQTITPIDRLFLRNNHTPPNVSAESWSLTIEGLVRHPLTISYDELRRLPTSSYVAVLECCGNGRKHFAERGQPAEGIQWCEGAVGNAEWIGVPVALLLERVGVKRSALQAECWSLGEEPFARGIEVSKLQDDAMLAYAVNGQPIPPIHGGPVRLVVPGWGGISWVKWISRMNLISHASDSVYNRELYVLYDAEGKPYGKVRELAVKSLITSPGAGTLRAGRQTIGGFAWSAGHGIVKVEVSTDGGDTWRSAELLHDLGPRSWRGFSMSWEATPGEYVLAARATDGLGATQPLEAPFNQRGYLMNAVQRVAVRVVG